MSLLHRPDDYWLYWFRTKLSTPYFLTKLHPWVQATAGIKTVTQRILNIVAIEITHLTRLSLLLLLRIQRYMWHNHIATWLILITVVGIWIKQGSVYLSVFCNIIFGFDLNLKNLNHFEKLKSPVSGKDSMSQYGAHCHDCDMQILH